MTVKGHGLLRSLLGGAMAIERDNLALARQFVSAVERGVSDEVAALLPEDVLHEEFPNRLMPNGATRDKAAILTAGERVRDSGSRDEKRSSASTRRSNRSSASSS
jgi:hypothetical protein